MFYVYILKSLKDENIYFGSTNDLRNRLSEIGGLVWFRYYRES
ncbi:hypothetical protein COW82_02945 [Candidatus Campbellbacteria bacterium CG22_combo_CG10-13_8_21_14_all_43_18]|uniref:GIY-YIG domain-containing protein n=1 Tax=Candidatus Campbellbacteria bacterium CG22_combo_CG10-13_8_21_14_all_43_18 TaxID=1974530 RepID=A0A2H0DVT5_9BACT|nr:MAG: hypothetical protein COW82_02945 [Candidatus Campbellbacteria bacterium CG22_combo_CG10-13_8_21_14_all_43_18]